MAVIDTAGQSEKNVTLPDSPNIDDDIWVGETPDIVFCLNGYQVDSRIGTIGSLINLILYSIVFTILRRCLLRSLERKERKRDRKEKVRPFIPKV